MPIADPYRAKLREALVGAVETKLVRQRRRAVIRRVALATAVIVAMAAAIVTVTLPDDRADATVDVEVRDGTVLVRLLDFENRPEEITGALRNAGIVAVVDTVPVGPSNVGRFVAYSNPGGSLLDVTEGTRFSFAAFSVPQAFHGELRLSLGRAATTGEAWGAASDALAPREALACRSLYGLTAAEAAPRVADVSATVSWFAVPDGPLGPGAELRSPHAGWRVIDALSPSEGLVVIRLTADGQWPFAGEAPPQVDPNCKGR